MQLYTYIILPIPGSISNIILPNIDKAYMYQ